MTQPARERRLFRFGVFEFDCSTGELRREGKSEPRLRDQAVQILSMLLERPREVVTRDELRRRLWPADTFVDFDHGVNSAINQLRNALGDSAANPRFIQTLPRRGYRFIAPIEIAGAANAAPTAQDPSGALDAHRSVLSDAGDLPTAPSGIVRLLFSLIQAMYLSFYVVALARHRQVDAVLQDSGSRAHWISSSSFSPPPSAFPFGCISSPPWLSAIAASLKNFAGFSHSCSRSTSSLALAPFLLVSEIGVGLAVAFTAALLYLPFSQRSLLLMAHISPRD